MNASRTSTRADRDALKRAAAEAAVQLVENDMIVGLGSGSTAAFAFEALARRHRQGLRFVGIPTSERAAAQAKAADIPLTSFGEHRQIDLTIDGADEVDRFAPARPRGRRASPAEPCACGPRSALALCPRVAPSLRPRGDDSGLAVF